MEESEIYLNTQQLEVLRMILKHVSASLNDCHYIANIKGDFFKHRLSGTEKAIMYTRGSISFSRGIFDESIIAETIGLLEKFNSEFTCGGHQLEVRLFNSLFFQCHQLKQLYRNSYLNNVYED